jgi:hypothetical protein
MTEPRNNGRPFDPFAASRLTAASKSWLWATALQAALTCGLLALTKLAEGRPWQSEARVILLLGIIATWGLALRTIRQRLVELMLHWRKASQGLLRKASASGRHLISVQLSAAQESYVKGAMWRLRVIAAGLTLPFFVMPLACALVAGFFAVQPEASPAWAPLAVFTLMGALIVAGYFHWSIQPLPVPVRVSGLGQRFPARRRGARRRNAWRSFVPRSFWWEK